MSGLVGKHWLALLQEDLDLVPSEKGERSLQMIMDRCQTPKCPVCSPNGLNMSLEKFPELSAKYRPKAQQLSLVDLQVTLHTPTLPAALTLALGAEGRK